MRTFWMGLGLACALGLAGCGGANQQSSNSKEVSQAARGTTMPDEANGGTVTGKVVFEGTPPVPKPLDMSATPYCDRAHKDKPAVSEDVVVNGNGTLKNAFVWVKSGLPNTGWQVPSTAVKLDQKGCVYVPHVIGVMAGQNVDFKTSDGTNHNIHAQPANNEEWNDSQPPNSEDRIRSFPHQDVMVPVKCNVHPWMRAYIGVVAHPFFAVTGDDGTFTIKGLPPGTYTIETWHEKYGTRDQQVTVGARETKTLDFTIKG